MPTVPAGGTAGTAGLATWRGLLHRNRSGYDENMLAFALLAAIAPLRFAVESTEFPTVVYHVSCLGGSIPCTKPEIEKFWRSTLNWTSTDQRQLDAWKGALSAVASRQPRPPEVPFLPNFAAYYPELVAQRRIVAAGLASRSPAAFRKRAALLASPDEIVQLSSALEHFQRRLRPWWRSTGARYAAARRRSIQSRLDAPNIAALGERISRFLQSEITGREFRVHLVPRSDPLSNNASATYVENHLLLELTDATNPDSAAGIIVHELTHALYELAPLQLHLGLIREFMASSEPESQGLYAILNEGIATGAQMIVMRQPERADRDVYNHPFIPRIGRAISGHLARALDHGPTLFRGFLESYVLACAAELKEELASPRFILSSAVLIPIGDLDEADKEYRSSFATISSAEPPDRDRYAEVNLAIMITYNKLEAIAGSRDEIVPLSRLHRGFAFSWPRKSKGRVYVLAGRDGAAVAEVVRRLAEIRTGTGPGLLLSLD